jgi:hypothetical protein
MSAMDVVALETKRDGIPSDVSKSEATVFKAHGVLIRVSSPMFHSRFLLYDNADRIRTDHGLGNDDTRGTSTLVWQPCISFPVIVASKNPSSS